MEKKERKHKNTKLESIIQKQTTSKTKHAQTKEHENHGL